MPHSGSALSEYGSVPRVLPESQETLVHRSKRGNIPGCRFEIEGNVFLYAALDEDEPASFAKVAISKGNDEWMVTMQEEMKYMAKNSVWELVDLLLGHKTTKNKWVLKVKCTSDDSIDKYKEHFVVKGYTQREGIYSEDTFSLMVRMASIHLILVIVVHLNL